MVCLGHSLGVLRLISPGYNFPPACLRHGNLTVRAIPWVRKFSRIRQAGNYSVVQANNRARRLPALAKPLACGYWGIPSSLIILSRQALRPKSGPGKTSGHGYGWSEMSTKGIFSPRINPGYFALQVLDFLTASIGRRKGSWLNRLL